MSADQIGVWAGFILTLMVFSYLIGDNFLYRLAIYIFVGLAAGFVTIVAIQSAILPWLQSSVLAPDISLPQRAFGIIPLLLSALLLLKISPRFGRIGNLGLAFIIGVGTAVALVGAIEGTLLPLTLSTAADSAARSATPALLKTSDTAELANGFVLLLGVVTTLVYFQYLARRVPGQVATTGRRGLFIRAVSAIGQGFIVVTLGALYGSAILTGFTVFSERIAFIITQLSGG